MADLNDLESADAVKIVGASSTGVEQTPVQSTANGALHSNLRDSSGNELIGQDTKAASIPITIASDQEYPFAANNNTVDPQQAISLGASDGTNIRQLQGRISNPSTTDYGLLVRNIENTPKKTYSAAVTNFNYANNGTDIFSITGSATKTIRIKHISVDGTRTTATNVSVQLVKRSTANTGGTPTTITSVPWDSNFATATATVRTYGTNPTTGTLVGILHSEKMHMPTATSAGGDELTFTFHVEGGNMSDVVLRGTNEVLAVNMNGVTATGNSMNIDIVWTEE